MVEIRKVNDDEEEQIPENERIFDLSRISLDWHSFSRPSYACFVEHLLVKEVSKQSRQSEDSDDDVKT